MEEFNVSEKKKYNEETMKVIREALGLNEFDTSKDDYIVNTMSKKEVFDAICKWYGMSIEGIVMIKIITSVYSIGFDTIE